jgi:hypothetical protein
MRQKKVVDRVQRIKHGRIECYVDCKFVSFVSAETDL